MRTFPPAVFAVVEVLNTFSDIEYILEHLGKRCGTRFEFECYDVGHLYNLGSSGILMASGV